MSKPSKPGADLDALSIPKGGDDPPASVAADAAGGKAHAHTLSLRLTSEAYRDLRRYVAAQEEKTGKRISHQALIEGLLMRFLADHKRD